MYSTGSDEHPPPAWLRHASPSPRQGGGKIKELAAGANKGGMKIRTHKNEGRTGRKPNSVAPAETGATAIHLRAGSRRPLSGLPERGAPHRAAWDGPPHSFLFGLAPRGVYPAAGVAPGAVRSYRTVSPLPRPKAGGLISVALSVPASSPKRAVPVRNRAALGSSDFPPVRRSGPAAVSPALQRQGYHRIPRPGEVLIPG